MTGKFDPMVVTFNRDWWESVNKECLEDKYQIKRPQFVRDTMLGYRPIGEPSFGSNPFTLFGSNAAKTPKPAQQSEAAPEHQQSTRVTKS